MCKLLMAVGVVFMSWLSSAQAQSLTVDPESIVPLPDKFDMEAPGADVPPEIARFHGAWVGTWGDDNDIRHILVVERVTPDGRADVVFAHGDSAFYCMYREWWRSEAKIADGVLTFPGEALKMPWFRALQYVFDGPDRLLQTSTFQSGAVIAGTLVRTDVAPLAAGDRPIEWPWPGRARVDPAPHGLDVGWRTADYARSDVLPACRVWPGAARDHHPRIRRRPESAQELAVLDRGALASRQGICRAGADAPRTRQVRGN
jgi:hypothetical protein